MRRRIWQFLLPIHHDVSSDRAWWLPYPEPCVSCQSPASAGLGSPGDSRSHSGHVGNTRRRRLITCCLLWPAARRFWLGLHLVSYQSPASTGLGRPSLFLHIPWYLCLADMGRETVYGRPEDRRSNSGHIGNTRRRQLEREFVMKYLRYL